MKVFARALRYLPRYRGAIAVGLLAIPLARALDIVTPILIGRGIDELTRSARGDGPGLSFPLSTYFLIFAGLALVKGVAKFAMRYYIVGASRSLESDLRTDVFAHLLRLPPAYFQSMRTGDLMSRLTGDIEAVRMFLGPGMMYVTETFMFLAPATVVLARLDVVLAVLMILPLSLIVWAMVHFAEPIHAESLASQQRLAEMSNMAQENFAGVRTVRAFAAEPAATARFDSASEAYRDQTVRAVKVRGLNWSLMMAARDLGMVVLIAVGSVRLIQGAISIGEYVVFNLYLGMLFWPMVALGWMVAMYQRAKASMERLEALFETPPAIADAGAGLVPARIDGAIELRGLRVRHGPREVLKGVSLAVAPGRVLGITGGTGSGKSTLLQALPRLIDVDRGQVFVDGIDVLDWNVERLRRAVGYVAQEAFLFADTLRWNLALGRDDEDEAALRAAVRAASFEDEVRALPAGLETVVGERGVTLSGGQRQRATIARALAADPQILLLDDCLSAVDAETEARILRELKSALRGRTALLVSHRVAALELADEVVVLEDGAIVEQGAPAELLRRRGRYHDLFVRQRMEQELAAL